MIKEIFVDLDGVLADFNSTFDRMNGLDTIPMHKMSNSEMQERRNLLYDTLPDFVEKRYWANLNPVSDFELGMNFLRQLDIPIRILSSTSSIENLFEKVKIQKLQWLKQYNIEFEPIFVAGKRFKISYAQKGNILIDDSLDTIENWFAKGEIGIHHINWENTIEELKKLL
jgi:hypothetical protein